MDRERLKLALEDRPLRSELDTINEQYEGRLRTAEAELRRHAAEQSNRLQVRGDTVFGWSLLRLGSASRMGVVLDITMQDRSRMIIDFRIPTMPGRSTSGFHRPGRHCLHQARSAVRCSASRMKGELHHTENLL